LADLGGHKTAAMWCADIMRKRQPNDPALELGNRYLLTVERTADILEVGRSKVYALLKEGKLKSVNLGPRIRRVTRDSVEALVAEAK
jgi:excisionase family DNA binding protein